MVIHHDLAEKDKFIFRLYSHIFIFHSTAVDHEFMNRLARKSGYTAKDISTFSVYGPCLKTNICLMRLKDAHEKNRVVL